MITEERTRLEELIAHVEEASGQRTGGRWLERATVEAAKLIKDWDIAESWAWADWPGREERFPNVSRQDIGVDVVAVRRSDGQHIAIQCKARQLDERGAGNPIGKSEIDSFVNTSAGSFWAEHWIVTNGSVSMGANAVQALSMHDKDKPIKQVNIAHDLRQQLESVTSGHDDCSHCESLDNDVTARQTKSCMQSEAVADSVRILREHEQSNSGGLPVGQARGKIILPCGTGKTRISLRVVEKLTPAGAVSVVLSPSIALVAQIRREYLQHARVGMRALAVCSDETAGYDTRKEDTRDSEKDPTVDSGNVSAKEVKGLVTTKSCEIAKWMRAGEGSEDISVIFGTYQSGHRIAKALSDTGITVSVLIADEAHRTAGLRRSRAKTREKRDADDKPLRDFTLCHDNDAFPAKYRVYQTATPRIYDLRKAGWRSNDEWLVRTMDDESTFGVDLYRKSYVEAVKNGWLADYRIIAIGINDREAYEQANRLARETDMKSRRPLTTSNFLQGLAFAMVMGGATQTEGSDEVPIKSCIAFMNTVEKSKNMAKALQTGAVRGWLNYWLKENNVERPVAPYKLEHLDATDNVTARDNAKQRLADASVDEPYGIINVGIFGEGTDAPSLSAVGFLEPRKSPIDVIQAVGRAMRTMPGKELGYIICPIVIPPNVDPELWLSVSDRQDWEELGQILLALRAHDNRIEDSLADMLELRLPPTPEAERAIVVIGDKGAGSVSYHEHEGAPGEAPKAVIRILDRTSTPEKERFQPIPSVAISEAPLDEQPTHIISGVQNDGGNNVLRIDRVVRDKPKAGEMFGNVDYDRSKERGLDMANGKSGTTLPEQAEPERLPREEQAVMKVFEQLKWDETSNSIRMNLLAKSGLTTNRIARDLNLLEGGVKEAAHHLEADCLKPVLDRHFGLDNLKSDKDRADGCTIAALLMMNAAMLHQRIANGRWMTGVDDLENVSNSVNVVRRVTRQWNEIIERDFKPVMQPARDVIYLIEDTGKLSGLERALRHLASEAARIAETYADMGSDHAGALFNRVMGDQTSDGAFFTRPAAASLAARLTLDSIGDADWSDEETWLSNKVVDLACGSGTLLAAMLSEMKRRARELGANELKVGRLQRTAVEKTIKGMDINPVSLQLAASQLTAGNQGIRYREMGLHLMPYGPSGAEPSESRAGTLELLGQRAMVAHVGAMDIGDEDIGSREVWGRDRDDAELEDAVEAAKNSRIVIMNPPFTNRANMGQKFPTETQRRLRSRVDKLENALTANDPSMLDFANKNAIAPLFNALADKCLSTTGSVFTSIRPSVNLSAPSAINERRETARRFNIRTVVACHVPTQVNMSQGTGINECIVVAKRHDGPATPTRFIALDRMPADDEEAADLHEQIQECREGNLANGWGEVSHWPVERIEEGDWTPGVWRSPELADAAYRFATHAELRVLGRAGGVPAETGRQLISSHERTYADALGSFPILMSKGAEGQTRIQSRPDEHWVRKQKVGTVKNGTIGAGQETDPILQKAGHLLITAGQNTKTGRVTATADDIPYLGHGWMPVTGFSAVEAKVLAVFINATPGRLQLMRNVGKMLSYPTYHPVVANSIRIPDVKDDRILRILSDCWERTKDMTVPQFGEGECEVRRLWDEAVAEAMGWDAAELSRLRHLLHREPHVCGVGYGQYTD